MDKRFDQVDEATRILNLMPFNKEEDYRTAAAMLVLGSASGEDIAKILTSLGPDLYLHVKSCFDNTPEIMRKETISLGGDPDVEQAIRIILNIDKKIQQVSNYGRVEELDSGRMGIP